MHPYGHRHRRQHRAGRVPLKFWASLICIVVLGVVAAVALMSPDWTRRTQTRSVWRSALWSGSRKTPSSGAKATERAIYPYSIVAGGVHDRAEFEKALKTDPVVAAHYADFDAAKFRVVKLQHPEYAYVSFRVGDNVYWTSHRVELREGEMLISDGGDLGRTRCGNRISQTPRLPTYIHEPTSTALNTPIRPKIETEAFTTGNPVFSGRAAVASRVNGLVGPGGVPGTSRTPQPSFNPFLGTPLVPAAGCSSGEQDVNGQCVSSNSNPPPPPVTPTPENDSWVLFVTGGALLTGFGAIRRRCLS